MSPLDKSQLDKFKRYYLFYGPNIYRLDERVKSLVSTVIEKGAEAFDLDRFVANHVDISNVINAASTPPVMSALRVVILTNVEKLTASSTHRLEAFLPKIPPYAVLAMTATKIDKRIKLFKQLAAQDKVHSYFYDLPNLADASRLIAEFASNRGKRVSTYVANAIVETFGVDAYRLENEVEKLALYVGEKSEIEKTDLAFASGFTHVETPYDLPDLLFAGKTREALELARAALASNISEMQLLWIFKNHLLRLNTAHALGNAKAIMSALHVSYGVAQGILSSARGVNQEAITKGLTIIFRAEYSLKSARFPSEVVIDLLIAALFLTFRGNIAGEKLYLV